MRTSRQDRLALVDKGCWLCRRPLGSKIQWHHYVPKSRGGRETVPIHPICHKALHVNFTNKQLEEVGADVEKLRADPEIERFLKWVANKKPDFHAPTRRRRH
ncbi:MAG: HNH endonuclease [Pseudomonadota bacterium]